MASIRTLTASSTVKTWLLMLPDECSFKAEALLKLSPRAENMYRNTILDAILCARAYRESIEIYNDKDDFWGRLYDEIESGDY